MSQDRKIFQSKACDEAAEALGGYQRIDSSISGAVWDALVRNPYGFKEVGYGRYSARYIVTKPYADVPALLWWFRIDMGDVIIEHVEEFENY